MLSTDLAANANTPIFLLIALAVIVYGILYVYKFLKLRQGIRYQQQLNQAIFSGSRNVYTIVIIFFEIIGCTILFTVHVYFVITMDENGETSPIPAISMSLIIFMMIFNRFVWNHKLW